MALVRLFAGAADAAHTQQTYAPVATVAELTELLGTRFGPDFREILGRCSLLVNGSRTDAENAPIHAEDIVDILPPFAGG